MKMRFFDFEVFPDWWLCVFGDMPEDINEIKEEGKKDYKIVHSKMDNARDLLLDLMREKDVVVCGYNIKHYDLIIANAIYQGFTPEQIKIINDMIINPGCMWSTKEHIRLQPFVKRKISGVVYQDLMDDSEGSLKEKEAVLGLNILESSVDFNKSNLTDSEMEDVIYYCKQDVYAAMYFYKMVVHPYTLTKLAMGKKFNIPVETCRCSTNARLVSLALGAKRHSYVDNDKIEIELPSKIREYCYENVPSKILEHLLTSTDSLTVNLFDNIVDYGNGGIHSVYSTNLYVESDEEYALVNVDATSYYPSMLIQFNCLSRSVENPKVFQDIFDERVRIKHKPNKTEEDDLHQRADKLVLNTTYGASGNKFLDLYDPHQCTRTCRVGQIFLTALAMKISHVNSAKIIQTNTDGILVYVRRKELPTIQKLMDEWTAVSGINMEMDKVIKIWQRDVNNYVMLEDDGKGGFEIKRRGAWLCDTWQRLGYVTVGALSSFVSAKAVMKYLIYGEDVIKNIVNNKNVMDFAITCKKGPSYSRVVQKLANGDEIELFKCNRVYASKDDSLGMIYKIKKYKDRLSYTKMANVPEHCRLLNNDLSTYTFDDIKGDLDYMYYIERAADLLDIPWMQLKGNKVVKTNRFNYFDNINNID